MNEQERFAELRRLPRAVTGIILLGLPFCMVLGFVTTLVRGIGRAFHYAWLEARGELAAGKKVYHEVWRTDNER